jgi:hypothetical protein
VHPLVDWLFWHTWWTWHTDKSVFGLVYHGFNLLEAATWISLGVLVLIRYCRHRKSPIEVAYAAAFLAFGLTDVREAWALQSWLIWLKLFNLLVLLWLRARVIRDHYPFSRLY